MISFPLKPALLLTALVLFLLVPVRSDDADIPVAPPAPPGTVPASPLLPPVALSAEESDLINASARGLAGEKAMIAAPWELTPEWKDYAQAIDGRWTYLNQVRLD